MAFFKNEIALTCYVVQNDALSLADIIGTPDTKSPISEHQLVQFVDFLQGCVLLY